MAKLDEKKKSALKTALTVLVSAFGGAFAVPAVKALDLIFNLGWF